MTEFIAEEIEVRFAKKPGPPTSFVWRGKEYEIVKILRRWRKLDLQPNWWQRRHRDFYIVRTDTGETLELYFHRGFGRRLWVLSKKLGAPHEA